MPTKLFPKDTELMTMEQGQTGDCFLLASLDCLLHLPEGRAKFKSMFTATSTGVTLRIKKSALSSDLQVKKVEARYGYRYSKATREHVFTISNSRLREIDADDSIGVKTNSLAIKILEHISPYFYIKTWSHQDAYGSIEAHNVVGNETRMVDITAFVSQLLGIEGQKITDVNKIIKLKAINPDYPIYISMEWGEAIHDVVHDRHALRISKITPNSDGSDYTFEMVNPWDNSKTENYTLTELKLKDPSFIVFSLNKQTSEFNSLLLTLPEDDGKLVFTTTQLSSFLKKLQSVQMIITTEDFKRAISLYKVMPSLGPLYAQLSKSEQREFYLSMYKANGDKDQFINAFLSKVQRLDVVKAVVREGLPDDSISSVLDLCLQAKDRELYALITKFDLLPQILKTRLSSELFLQRLVEMELLQVSPNGKRLVAINEYVSAYNFAYPRLPLNVTIDAARISSVVLTKEESKRLAAQRLILLVAQRIENLPIFFRTQTSLEGIAKIQRDYFTKIGVLTDEESVLDAVHELDPKAALMLDSVVNKKLHDVAKAAEEQALALKHAQTIVDKYVHSINFSITFANLFNDKEVDAHVLAFNKKADDFAATPELTAASILLGHKLHPSIVEVVKNKKAEIDRAARQRIEALNAADGVLEDAIKRILVLEPFFTGLYSTDELNREYVKHINTLNNIYNDRTVREACNILGIKGDDVALKNVYEKRHRAITTKVRSKINEIGEVEAKVETYLNKIKTLGVDFSKVESETAIKNISASLLGKLGQLKEQLEADTSLTAIPTAKENIRKAIKGQETAVVEAGVKAHNYMVYKRLKTMLEDSGLNKCFRVVSGKAEELKEAALLHKRYVPLKDAVEQLSNSIAKSRVKLLNIPTSNKISTVQIQEKIQAFKSGILSALEVALPHFELNTRPWQKRLLALTESLEQMDSAFEIRPVPTRFGTSVPGSCRDVSSVTNPHRLFSGVTARSLKDNNQHLTTHSLPTVVM
jgi:hypothetical protein